MKTLTLVRHAKSDWDDPALDDHDRPLNKRGLRNAPEMGQRLAAEGARYDAVFCSSANRARTTATLVFQQLEGAPVPEVCEELYTFDGTELLGFILRLDDSLERVAIVSHNPGTTVLACWLTGTRIDNVPTCGMVKTRIDVPKWSEVREGMAELIEFDYPKRLGQ